MTGKSYDINVNPAVKSLNKLEKAVGKYNDKLNIAADRQKALNAQQKSAITRLANFNQNVSSGTKRVGRLVKAIEKLAGATAIYDQLALDAAKLSKSSASIALSYDRASGKIRAFNIAVAQSTNAVNAEESRIRVLNRTVSGLNNRFKGLIATFDAKNARLGLQESKLRSDAAAMAASGRSANIFARTLRRLNDIVFTFVGYGALFLVTNELRQSIGAAKEWTKSVSEIRTISDRNAVSTERWTEELTNLSNSFGISFLDAAEGAYQALSNQVVNAADSFNFLQSEAVLALTTVSTLEASVGATTAVINAYGESASAAARINAILFKTVEEGRIRLEDMSDTIGRVAILSSQLGVSFVEQQAALTQLTKLGLRTEEAMTLLRNVELKLIKPSETMSELFQEWGFTSGQAAVQTLGLAGVMSRFLETAKEGGDVVAELGDIFTRLRAVVGAVGLTQEDLNKEIEKFGTAAQDHFGAFLEITNSLNTRATRQIQQFSNTFVQEFGLPVLVTLVDLADKFGGLEATTIQAFTVMRDGAVILATLSIAYYGVRTATALNTIATNLNTFATVANLSVQEKLTKALYAKRLAQGLVIIGITAAVYAIYRIITAQQRYEDSIRTLKAELKGEFAEAAIIGFERLSAVTADAAQKGLASIDRFEKGYLGRIASLIKANNDFSQSVEDAVIAAADSFSDLVENVIEKTIDKIKDLRKEIDSLQDSLKSGEKRVAKAELKLEVDEALQNAVVIQDLKDKITELENRAKEALTGRDSQGKLRLDERTFDDINQQIDRLREKIKEFATEKIPEIKLPPLKPLPLVRRQQGESSEDSAARQENRRELQQQRSDRHRERQNQLDIQRQEKLNRLAFFYNKEIIRADREHLRLYKEYLVLLDQEAKRKDALLTSKQAQFDDLQVLLERLDTFDFETAKPGDFQQLRGEFANAPRGLLSETDRLQVLREFNQKEFEANRQAAVKEKEAKLKEVKENTISALEDFRNLLREKEKLENEFIAKRTTGFKADAITETLAEITRRNKKALEAIRATDPAHSLRGETAFDRLSPEERELREGPFRKALEKVKEIRELLKRELKFPTDEGFAVLIDKFNALTRLEGQKLLSPESINGLVALQSVLEGIKNADTAISEISEAVIRVQKGLNSVGIKLDDNEANNTLDQLEKRIERLKQLGASIRIDLSNQPNTPPQAINKPPVTVNLGGIVTRADPEEVVSIIKRAIRRGELIV